MKPIYLVDSTRNILYELPESKIPISIGRSSKCDLITPPKDITISRTQIEIRYTANQITIRQISENSKTYIGTKENSLEKLLDFKEPETLAIGNTITMGDNKYQLEIKSYQQVKNKLIEEETTKIDTVKTKSIE